MVSDKNRYVWFLLDMSDSVQSVGRSDGFIFYFFILFYVLLLALIDKPMTCDL